MQNPSHALCSKQAIIARNKLYADIRVFFLQRNVLEVETPLLADATVTDPFIDSFEVFQAKDYARSNKLYLQTSPEFYMKRLLASGYGDIFQICKAFRSEENGKKHNQEFTMLEWYRVGFNLENLMDEMADLLSQILETSKIVKFSYQQLFLEFLDFDFNTVDDSLLKQTILQLFPGHYDAIINDVDFEKNYNKDDLLTILLCDYIEPKLPADTIVFLYDYPPSQAALAKIDHSQEYAVAKRFEVYFSGVELANGYYELADHLEQARRFEADLTKRKKLGFPVVNTDDHFLMALESGLPECSGVALGLDRLLMLKLNKSKLDDVLAFR